MIKKINNSISEIKSNLDTANSWLNATGEQTSDLEDKITEITN